MKNILLILLMISVKMNGQITDSNAKKMNQLGTKEFIFNETKEGGKIDFFTPIKGKEYNGSQLKPGVFISNIEIALYKWGKANFELGIASIEEVYVIYEQFKGRELSVKEKDLIKMGYNKELEKNR